ncbi:MAG: hypothetical protein J6J04_04595 [Oscillospiraceae bacterium]|nr:hypothetical protein [Oscillospiraceae bacterium]
MKKSVKIFLIVMLCLLAIGLIFIGAGMVTGGDFGDVIQGIVIDLQGRLSGIIAEEPIIG